ncbi:PBP1A family penicillin-binding protein [Methylobacterium brachythecii]|uniref:1A family penicillin-binding protein n=1 Tax=Methylobacterium brachythecii TaxID=1176177 RepID=A0A7W6AKT4_9HYPH|nr:PBP1A family penicillin-binding protein [Methylobacterium brachythecii]MBB3905260.1 1A family penicillin-binding protein [Methylobacterium brachythecii]
MVSRDPRDTSDRPAPTDGPDGSRSPGQPDPREAAREAASAARVLVRQLGLLATAGLRGAGRSGLDAARAAKPFFARVTKRTGPTAGEDVPARSAQLPDQPATRGGWLSRLRRRPILAIGLAALALPALLLGFTVLQAFATLPPLGGVVPEGGQRAITVEADDGRPFATRGAYRGERLTAADMPPHLAQAITAIEDRRFYSHWGIDLRGLARAVYRNVTGGGVREGGSTITQQYARLTSLTQEKTLRRKIQEALLALRLESTMTKQEILLGYLNTAYFGAGAYGVDAAARRYFGHGAKALSLSESAMLAGLVRAPSQLAPTRNFGGAKERADLVLQAMVETGAITQAQSDKTRAEKLTLRTPPETPPGANYFIDMVAGDAKKLAGDAGDVTLRTTLNIDLQSAAQAALARKLDAEGEKKKVGQGALIAMSKDGAILAMVGGRDYEDSQFNRAIQAKRQAGSLFKLFVYLAAYQRGYTPETVLVDRPTQIGEWEPQNSNNRFRGALPLRSAFALSVNTIAAQLGDEIGIASVIEAARKLGVQSDLPNVPSLALGSADVSLMEMTRAYAGVLTGAPPVDAFAIHTIKGSAPKPLYLHEAKPAGAALSRDVQSMMLDSMEAVVEGGTGKAARLPGTPIGGKTGTSQDYRDAWFVGVTSDMVVGVWVGNDDNAPMKGVTGGDIPARVFHDFVQRAQVILKGKKRPAPSAAKAERAPAGEISTSPVSSDLRGVPEVIDTGTLAIRGRTVKLAGIVGERGALAQQLARYLRRREVACAPEGASGAMRCRLDGDDLASLILTAGGAKATEDAPQDLLEAEDQARSERAGLWGRERY